MASKEIINDANSRMGKAIDTTRANLSTIRTGRASVGLLDRIQIDYYGTPTPINQVASVNAPEARLLVVQPWDKSIIADIEKAVMKSDLGLSTSNDGQVIRIPIPQLTEERRKELIKVVKSVGEEGRVAVRNIRRDANEHLKALEKNHEISKDDLQRDQGEIQKLTDKHIETIDNLLSAKEKEVLEV